MFQRIDLAATAVGSLIALSGCLSNQTIDSQDVNEEKLYGQYRVSYSEDSQKLTLFAQLRVAGPGGTSVKLSPPEEITADGNRLELHDGASEILNLIGTYYQSEETVSAPQSNYAFAWKSRDGSSFVNRVQVADRVYVTYPAANTTYNKGVPLTVKFGGIPLRSGESVIISVVSSGRPLEGQYSSVSAVVSMGSEHAFEASEIGKLAAGQARIKVSRITQTPRQQGHLSAGADLDSTYESGAVPIHVME